MATIDELIVELFQDGLGSTIDLAKKFVGTVVAGAAAITAFVVATSAATDEQGKMADQIGISVEDLDAWQHAATLAGGSADGMANSLEQLSIRASEASRGTGSGVEAFGLLGVSALDAQGNLKDTTQLMLEVSEAMVGMDRAKQIELADKLGLKDSIRLLQAGPSAIRGMIAETKELGVVTDKDAQISAEFNDALADKMQIMKQVARIINRELAPFLTKQLKLTKEWWKANRALIEQKLPEWIEKGVKILKLLAIVASAFIALRLVTTIFSLIKAFRAFRISVMLANAAVATLPILIAVAAAAILLLAQDAKVFFEGGESAIGRLIERFPEWEGTIIAIAAALATVWDMLGMVVEGWKEIFNIISNLSVDGIKQFGSDIVSIFKLVVSDISNMFSEMFSSILSFGKEKLSGLGDLIKDKLSIIPFSDKIFGDEGGNGTLLNGFNETSMPSQATTTQNNSTSSNSTSSIGQVTINVDGSNSPGEVAKEIQAKLQEASQNVSSAVSL